MSKSDCICDACGESFEGQPYGILGGNFVPYMPAKRYHIQCIPIYKPKPDRLELAEEKLAQCGIEWDGEKYVFNGKD